MVIPSRLPAPALVLGGLAALVAPNAAHAFCGMYVAGAGADLYNEASQVAIARDGDLTTLSMRNDYDGPLIDFALVVPVPVVLKEEDVRTIPAAFFDRLDALSAPRLVEYFERDPCARDDLYEAVPASVASGGSRVAKSAKMGAVQIEARFDVDEYKVVILSATESNALETWLRENGYALPKGAAPILAPYIKRQSKFFAAKVDATKVKRSSDGKAVLSPLQFSFRAPVFELPIRLGMVNGKGVQDLIIYALTPEGRVTVTNYPTVPVPTDVELGDKVPGEGDPGEGQPGGKSRSEAFRDYYLGLFNTAQDGAGGAAVLSEYAWASSSCDPCPTPALTPWEMRQLGVASGRGVLTRLHARYSAKLFRDDLVLGIVPHEASFQGRYILRHPWTGPVACKEPRRGVWGPGPAAAMTGSMSGPATMPVGPWRGAPIDRSFRQTMVRELRTRVPALSEVCGKAGSAPVVVKVRLDIAPDGRVERVERQSGAEGPVAECVERELRKWKLPPPGQRERMVLPLRIVPRR